MTKSNDPSLLGLDHTSHPDFYEYYANESQSEATAERFGRVQDTVERIALERGMHKPFAVADIGCGAGTQSRLWAAQGHKVRALDVNDPLICLARKRAEDQRLDIEFSVGTA